MRRHIPLRYDLVLLVLAGVIGAGTCQGVLATAVGPIAVAFPGDDTTRQDADEQPEPSQPGDEIWFVSARSINVETTDLSHLKVEFFNKGSWEPASLSELLESHRNDTTGETVLYVHGNRTDEYNGKYRGRQVFQNFFAGWPSPRPSIRFVIWAWNSDRVGHGTNDFCIKSRRAVRLGAIFSETVAGFDSANPPLIIGYSLGCQVIAKAFTYDVLSTPPTRYRLALIAPVLDCRFSCLSGGSPQSCESILQTVILFNQKDIVTSLARRICIRQSGNQFRSFEQWVQSPSLPLGPVRQVDVTATSSCQHSIIKYSSEPTVKQSIRSLLQETNAAAAESE